jgi:hypothetical protein
MSNNPSTSNHLLMQRLQLPLTTLALMLATAHLSTASALIYEGFDAAAANGVPIAGLAGASSAGLSGTWNSVSAGTATATYQSSGLTFSGMPTQGGALLVSASTTDGAVNAYRPVTVGVAAGSTLYGSFLFQTQAIGSQYVSVLGVETGATTNFANNPITPHRLGDNDDPFRFTINPDTFNGSSLGTNGVKVRRYNTNGSIANAAGSANLANGETYLAIFSLTNAYVGDGTAGLVAQTASVWILNNTQFQALDLTNLSEGALDAGFVSKSSLNNGFQGGLTAGYYLNIAALAAGAAGTNATIYDELRMGSSLQAVVVPEPATYGLVLGALSLLLIWRRQRVV